MPTEDLFSSQPFKCRESEEWVHTAECASCCQIPSQKLLVKVLLEIIDEKHSVNSSFPRLNEFNEGSVSWHRLIHGVGLYPHVTLALVYDLPQCFEELIT